MSTGKNVSRVNVVYTNTSGEKSGLNREMFDKKSSQKIS
jgi:hypothetical protein